MNAELPVWKQLIIQLIYNQFCYLYNLSKYAKKLHSAHPYRYLWTSSIGNDLDPHLNHYIFLPFIVNVN